MKFTLLFLLSLVALAASAGLENTTDHNETEWRTTLDEATGSGESNDALDSSVHLMGYKFGLHCKQDLTILCLYILGDLQQYVDLGGLKGLCQPK